MGELRLRNEGLTVLGIVRSDGSYVGVPGKDTPIEVGDTVILYGRATAIAELGQRPTGAKGRIEHERRTQEEHRPA